MSKNMMETISNMLRLELNLSGIQVSLIRPGGHATSLMDKTMKVLNRIPKNSYFREELLIIQKEGSKRILEVKKDPIDVAKVIYKALTDSNPRNIYNVNVSFLYKLLSLIPANLREYLVLRALKK
jgi:short-subunit dehydrogenase